MAKHFVVCAPGRYSQSYGRQVIGFPHSQFYESIVRIIGFLSDAHILRLKRIVTIKIHPERIFPERISIFLSLTQGAQRIGRATEATDVMLTMLGPAHHVREIFVSAQRLR